MAEMSTNAQTQSEIKISEAIHNPVIHGPASNPTDFVDDGLIETLWQDLDGLVSHEKVRQTANDVAAIYVGARVMTFITIFIRRHTLERLKR